MEEKYKILFLSSLIILSFSYVYDLPVTLNEQMNFNEKASKLAFLYSVYTFPNIVIPLFFRWTTSMEFISGLLCFLVLLGQVLYTLGVYKMHYPVMVLGRFVYGLGGESFSILINKLLSKEFKGKNLAFTLGLFSSITRVGAILNFLTSPILAEKVHRIVPCGIGILMTFITVVSCCALNNVLSKQKEVSFLMLECKKNSLNFNEIVNDKLDKKIIMKSNNLSNNNIESKVDYSQIFYQVDFNQSPFSPWEDITSNYTSEISEQLEDSTILDNTIFYEPSFTKAKTFHSTFSLLAVISFLIALIWAPFYSLAPILFKTKYNIKSVESGNLLSMIEILGLVLTPIVGKLADKYGKKIYYILLGCLFIFIAHFCIAFNKVSPYFVVSLLGFAGPLVNCYWPCIPYLVSENNLTNGFAIIFCLLNLAFTLSPLLMGYFMTLTGSFEYVEVFILGITVSAFLVTGLLIYLNRSFGLGLNKKSEIY